MMNVTRMYFIDFIDENGDEQSFAYPDTQGLHESTIVKKVAGDNKVTSVRSSIIRNDEGDSEYFGDILGY